MINFDLNTKYKIDFTSNLKKTTAENDKTK